MTGKIIRLGMSTKYLTARKIASGYGLALPSNVLLDEYLLAPGKRDDLRHSFPLWARELLVYPEKDGAFSRRDVVDSTTGWVLPSGCLPEDAIGRRKIGLFVEPGAISVEKGKTVVHPAKIVLLHPFIQENGRPGQVDDVTRVPLDLHRDSAKDSRRLYRIGGTGIRPIIRDSRISGFGRRDIIACSDPDHECGVAGTREDYPSEPLIMLTPQEFVELVQALGAASPPSVPAFLVSEAKSDLEGLLKTVPPDKLSSIIRLIAALQDGGARPRPGFIAEGFEPVNGC